MNKWILILFLSMAEPALAQNKGDTLSIIFDTDIGPDYDDVGALAMLHAFADYGKVNILATIASNKYEGVAGVLNVFNTYFQRPGIPIGVPVGEAVDKRDWQHWTDSILLKYPHSVRLNNEAYEAVKLYRKILCEQPDHSVTIITVGFLTNIANLLKSFPDDYSPVNGNELVKQKVRQLVSMAGSFPEGSEFNIVQDIPASKYVAENCPVPILFSGVEIGRNIRSGIPLIRNENIQNSPVRDVFRICIPLAIEDSAGRKSWDETAVFTAIADYAPYYRLIYGHIRVNPDGKNTWQEAGKNQSYLKNMNSDKEMEKLINTMIMHQPGER